MSGTPGEVSLSSICVSELTAPSLAISGSVYLDSSHNVAAGNTFFNGTYTGGGNVGVDDSVMTGLTSGDANTANRVIVWDLHDGKKVLERISQETGGRMFEVSKKEPLDQIYRSIQEELRNQYNLGFSPAKADSDGYHKLLLKTTQKEDTVQARDGFYLNPD